MMSQDGQQMMTNNNNNNKGFAHSGVLSGVPMFWAVPYTPSSLCTGTGLQAIVLTFYHACSAR